MTLIKEIRFWRFRLAKYQLSDGLAVDTSTNTWVRVSRYRWHLEKLRTPTVGHPANKVWW